MPPQGQGFGLQLGVPPQGQGYRQDLGTEARGHRGQGSGQQRGYGAGIQGDGLQRGMSIMESPVHQQPYLGKNMWVAEAAPDQARAGVVWEDEGYDAFGGGHYDDDVSEGFDPANGPGPYTRHHVTPTLSSSAQQLLFNEEQDERCLSHYAAQAQTSQSAAPEVVAPPAPQGHVPDLLDDMKMMKDVWSSCNVAKLEKESLYWCAWAGGRGHSAFVM